MTALVLDSSAIVEYLRWTPSGEQVAARFGEPDRLLHVPHLSSVEVTSAFRGLVLGRVMTVEAATGALDDLIDLPVQRHPVESFIERVWQLRDNLTVYDATYVALAESLDCPLLTADRKFDTPTVRRLITIDVIS